MITDRLRPGLGERWLDLVPLLEPHDEELERGRGSGRSGFPFSSPICCSTCSTCTACTAKRGSSARLRLPVLCHYSAEPQTSKCQALQHAADSVCSAELSGSGTFSWQDVQHGDTDALGCLRRVLEPNGDRFPAVWRDPCAGTSARSVMLEVLATQPAPAPFGGESS